VIRVGVIGACGRMGLMVCRAVAEADDLALVAAIDRSKVGQRIGALIGHPEVGVPISDELDRLLEAEAEVAIDFTHPDVVMDTVRWCVNHAIHLVVGTTGIMQEDVKEIEAAIGDEGAESNVIVASNFALGAVLMLRFAAQAVRYFPAVEIVELHHDQKADAPSGTAIATVRRLQEERAEPWRGPLPETLEGVRGGDVEGIRVHSVRLPGLVAHQEVIFGGQGQTLTIRHDSTDRSSFMPGVLMAARAVMTRPGLTIGLEPLLDLPPLPER
jgi:4-hydroxy-tetrahydrodipicolinate reductase